MIEKYKGNPIIDKHTESQYDPSDLFVVFNPAAFEHDGWTYVIARAEFKTGISKFVTYRSKDGLTQWQSVLIHSCLAEDPRVTLLEGDIYCTYTKVEGTLYSPAVRKLNVDSNGRIIYAGPESILYCPKNKDVVLFPKKIDGKFWALHRPELGSVRNIWISWSKTDAFLWEGHSELICATENSPWKAGHVGAGVPPIETDDGWLILYHGVKSIGYGGIYRMGAALLDKDNPASVISELPYWIMGPELPYEVLGYVGNVVFPTGYTQNGNMLKIYYGAADQSICVAYLYLPTLLDRLREHKK